MQGPLDTLIRMRLEGNAKALPDDDTSQLSLPILWSFLTRRDVDGNLSKEPATINIRLGLGAWLVTITDPSLEVTLTASVTVLSEALAQLEEVARSPNAPWAPWRRSVGKFTKVNRNTTGQEAKSTDNNR